MAQSECCAVQLHVGYYLPAKRLGPSEEDTLDHDAGRGVECGVELSGDPTIWSARGGRDHASGRTGGTGGRGGYSTQDLSAAVGPAFMEAGADVGNRGGVGAMDGCGSTGILVAGLGGWHRRVCGLFGPFGKTNIVDVNREDQSPVARESWVGGR